MGVKQYDTYTEQLALLGQWDPPGLLGRDIAEQVRSSAASNQVAAQGIQILQTVWKTLPGEFRKKMVDQLEMAVGDLISESLESADAIPVIGAIIVAVVDGAMKIAEATRIITDWKRAKSNYAHGKAQQKTIF